MPRGADAEGLVGLPRRAHASHMEPPATLDSLLISHVCSRCGREAPYGFGDQWLCLDCYGVLGSCCIEFGEEDRTK